MIDDMPPHTCQLGPQRSCRACEWLEWEQARAMPTEEQINDWNIHNDHQEDPHEEFGFDYPWEL